MSVRRCRRSDAPLDTTGEISDCRIFKHIGRGQSDLEVSFDGQGHSIYRLHINRPSGSAIGLFGLVLTGAEIKNVHLIDAHVRGDTYVGTLIGRAKGGRVSHSSATGQVNVHPYGQGAKSGGLIGSVGGGAYVTEVWADVQPA